MRYLAVFFFSHLAVTVIATECVPNDRVDPIYLAIQYEVGVDSVPVPSLEYGDLLAGKFRDIMTDSVKSYGVGLLDLLYHQTVQVGDKLIDGVRAANQKLQRSIKSITLHNKKPDCLDDDLKELINQLETVLELNPGEAESKRSVLPPMFEQPIEYQSRTTNRTAKEVFIDGDATINSISSNIIAYGISLFRAGWSRLREEYHVFSSQLRNQILNEKVLDTCKKVVNEVYEEKDLVRGNVLPETWKSYRNAAHRILKAYENYKASEEKKDC